MASAVEEAVTGPAPPPSVPMPPGTARESSPAHGWGPQPWTHVGNTPPPYPATARTLFSGPHHVQQPPSSPSAPKKRPGGRHGILVGALVLVATLALVGAVVAFVEVTRHGDPGSAKPSTAAAGGVVFTGTYRADYGPGTDLDDKPVANAPATTNNWDVRSECGADGCVATAASAPSGNALLSNMTFDQLGGSWVAVGLASAQCGTPDPVEIWVIMTLQPHPDGTLSGETVRASTNSACAAKRTVKFTRTGDPDPNKVADPSVLPPRAVSPADGLRDSYRETTSFTDGTVHPPKVLDVTTYCLRTGDRCMSLFHAGGEVVTLMFANDKWARDEQGNTSCPAGAAQVKITAEYPMPQTLDDPISVLNGRGNQTILPGGPCTGGGDFQDTFERTGD